VIRADVPIVSIISWQVLGDAGLRNPKRLA
jgi:hypothetical protein